MRSSSELGGGVTGGRRSTTSSARASEDPPRIRAATAQRSLRCPRRVPPRRHCPEPEDAGTAPRQAAARPRHGVSSVTRPWVWRRWRQPGTGKGVSTDETQHQRHQEDSRPKCRLSRQYRTRAAEVSGGRSVGLCYCVRSTQPNPSSAYCDASLLECIHRTRGGLRIHRDRPRDRQLVTRRRKPLGCRRSASNDFG